MTTVQVEGGEGLPQEPATPQDSLMQEPMSVAPSAEQGRVVEAASDADEITRGEKIAIANFAAHHNIAVGEVTLKQVQDDSKGVFYWATVGGDWTARGKHGQAFSRAIRHDAQVQAMYRELDDCLAREFRQKWAMKQDFAFTHEEREIRSEYKKENIDAGKYVTRYQLSVLLGIAACPVGTDDRKKVLAQTDRYFQFAKTHGGIFYTYHEVFF